MSKNFSVPEQMAIDMDRMLANARGWLAGNQGEAKIQFNYPKTMCLVGTVNQGLEMRCILADLRGSSLIEAICTGLTYEPTINMLRTVLSVLDEEGTAGFSTEHRN